MKTAKNSIGLLLALAISGGAIGQDDDPVMKALVDELGRSMTVKLEDLQSPYFVQYAVDETDSWYMTATCGALVGSNDNRGSVVSSIKIYRRRLKRIRRERVGKTMLIEC